MAGTAPTGFQFTSTPNAGPVHCSVLLACTPSGRTRSAERFDVRDVQIRAKSKTLAVGMRCIWNREDQGLARHKCHFRMDYGIAFAAAHHHTKGLERCTFEDFTKGIGRHGESVPNQIKTCPCKLT